MFNSDFKNVLDKISLPILVAEPIFSDEEKTKIDDFLIHFVNESFSQTFYNLTRCGGTLSDFSSKLGASGTGVI